MDLNAARMFVHVVQAGSLTAAAERMGVPLPTLSRRIRELERQLQVQLLERSVRGTRLTDAGARLYEQAARGIEVLADAERAVASDQARLRGRLRLSLPPSFEPWWMLLSAFRQRHPDIRLQVFTTERRVDLVEDGIDVALRVGEIVHESMVARRLIEYRHVLVASPALVRRLGLPATIDDLRGWPCAVWSQGAHARGTWQLGGQTLEPDSVLASNDYAHLCRSALDGEVVTELPPFLAAPAIRRGRLIALLPDQPLPMVPIHLLYPSHRHPSALVRAYLDFCRQQSPALLAACSVSGT